jgi:hypothetical protein
MNPAPHPDRWTLRFVLLGGAVAWTLHLLGCYVFAEFGVLSGLVDVRRAGLDAVSWLLFGWSAAMLALAAVAARAASRLRVGAAAPDSEARKTLEFCARFGRASNLAFLAIIAVQTVPIFFYLRTS